MLFFFLFNELGKHQVYLGLHCLSFPCLHPLMCQSNAVTNCAPRRTELMSSGLRAAGRLMVCASASSAAQAVAFLERLPLMLSWFLSCFLVLQFSLVLKYMVVHVQLKPSYNLDKKSSSGGKKKICPDLFIYFASLAAKVVRNPKPSLVAVRWPFILFYFF